MIITNVIGGLGNQMFQYAFGRALSLRYGVPLKVDLREFEDYATHNGFMLDKLFRVHAVRATSADRRNVLGWRGHIISLKLLRRPGFEPWRGHNLLVQDLAQGAAHYTAAASERCYLLGYWQSEAYFGNAAEQIRSDFEFLPELGGANQIWAQRIVDRMAVSVHVRRGDYASDPQTNATHGLCSPPYYERAMAYVAARVSNAEFFIFSDDLAWCRRTLVIRYPHHFVDCNTGPASFEDMRLISLCRHHIIANSSFSWWGAWLSKHANKIVIAPVHWFQHIPTPEVVPPYWIRL